MPRAHRAYDDDTVLHVVNRGNDRRQLFAATRDYAAFLGLVAWAQERTSLRLLGYVVMPNHWHLVAWPSSTSQLSRFMHHLTGSHAALLRRDTKTTGTGHIYQDRYHAFVIDTAVHYYRTLRYIEANPVRAGLVDRAERWQWSSLHERLAGGHVVSAGPVPLPPPDEWATLVNVSLRPHETAAIRPKRPRLGIAALWGDQARSTAGT